MTYFFFNAVGRGGPGAPFPRAAHIWTAGRVIPPYRGGPVHEAA